jgi:hypothetical protein
LASFDFRLFRQHRSNSEVELADADFRFTPESRHPAVGLGCPFRAKSGRRDHLSGGIS